MQCWFRKDKSWIKGTVHTEGDWLILENENSYRHCSIERSKYRFGLNLLEIDGFIPGNYGEDCTHAYYQIRFTEPEPYSG